MVLSNMAAGVVAPGDWMVALRPEQVSESEPEAIVCDYTRRPDSAIRDHCAHSDTRKRCQYGGVISVMAAGGGWGGRLPVLGLPKC